MAKCDLSGHLLTSAFWNPIAAFIFRSAARALTISAPAPCGTVLCRPMTSIRTCGLTSTTASSFPANLCASWSGPCACQGPTSPGDSWSLRHEPRSEEHTTELQSLMRISYAVFCLQKINQHKLENQYVIK